MPTHASTHIFTRRPFCRLATLLVAFALVVASLHLVSAVSVAQADGPHGTTGHEGVLSKDVVPYRPTLAPPNMLVVLLDDGQLEAYDTLRPETERLLWRTNTTPPNALGHRHGRQTGLRSRESIAVAPSIARTATDPLALPFIVRGNRLFTRTPLWSTSTDSVLTNVDGASHPYRTTFYHGNVVDNSLPEDVRPYFFMNISSLIRRQRVQLGETEVYVTTSIAFDDIDSMSGTVVHRSADPTGVAPPQRTLNSASGPVLGVRTGTSFPTLRLSQHTVTIHAYCAGEYQWAIELPSVDLAESAKFDVETTFNTNTAHTLEDDINSAALAESPQAGSGAVKTPSSRRYFVSLAELVEKIRGTVRPPRSLRNLHSSRAECEEPPQRESESECTNSQYPTTTESAVLSQDVDGVIKVHHIDHRTGRLLMTPLTGGPGQRHTAAVAAAFAYSPHRVGQSVQRVPLFHAEPSLSQSALVRAPLASTRESSLSDGHLPVALRDTMLADLLDPSFHLSDSDRLTTFNEGFSDADLEAEDTEGAALERVLSGYMQEPWSRDAATLYRRMRMSSMELAKELNAASGVVLPSPTYKAFWRWVVFALLHVTSFASSLGLTLAGVLPRSQLLKAWEQSDRYRHRPAATPKLGHHSHPPRVRGVLMTPQLLYTSTEAAEFPVTCPDESFDVLPASVPASVTSLGPSSTPGVASGAMMMAPRWSAAASSTSESSSSDEEDSSDGSDSESDASTHSRTGGGDGSASGSLERSRNDRRVRHRKNVSHSRKSNTNDDDDDDDGEDDYDDTASHEDKRRSSRRHGSRRASTEVATTRQSSTSAEGRLFQEHFRIISRIGVGGEGSVFCVEHRVTHFKYAVKAVNIQEQDEQRVVQEAVLHSSFDNPHVVRFYFCWIQNISINEGDAMQLCDETKDLSELSAELSTSNQSQLRFTDDEDDDVDGTSTDEGDTYRMLFIQMEYFPFGTLADELSRRTSFYRLDNLLYLKQITEGLLYLHQKEVVHRDVKPTNIFLSVDDRIKRMAESDTALDTTKLSARHKTLKIGDFGLAKQRNGQSTTVADVAGNVAGGLIEQSVVGGTPLYCSPEQLEGKSLGKPTDVFSLGIVAVELYCLFTTFHERSRILTEARHQQLPEDMLHQFPEEAALVVSMLSPYPNRRPSAATVLSTLETLIEQEEEQNRGQQRNSQAAARALTRSTFPDAPLSNSVDTTSPTPHWTGLAPSAASSPLQRKRVPSTAHLTPVNPVDPGAVAATPENPTSTDTSALPLSPLQWSTHRQVQANSEPSARVLSPSQSRESAVNVEHTQPSSVNEAVPLGEWLGLSDRESSLTPGPTLVAVPASEQPPVAKPRGTLFTRRQRRSTSAASFQLLGEEEQSVCSTHSAASPSSRADTAVLADWPQGSTLQRRVVSTGALDDWTENAFGAYGSQRVEVQFTDDPDFSAALRSDMKARRQRQSSVEKL